ncbi:hypothetical protein SOVF_157200 [Spinacia oleracea]|nr:hypothetical protein SOVF_157200 [Spinacia oleracea]
MCFSVLFEFRHWSGVGVTLELLVELASGSSLLFSWLLLFGE